MSESRPSLTYLAGHPEEAGIICVRDEVALIVNVAREECEGRVPVECDTDNRVDFGPVPNTCFIGSWRKGIRAWDYRLMKLHWHSPIAKFDRIQHWGNRRKVKVQKEGTVFLDAEDGQVLERVTRRDIYLHPTLGFSAGFDPVRRKVEIFDEGSTNRTVASWGTFAVLSHAWSNNYFVAGGADGSLFVSPLSDTNDAAEYSAERWSNFRDLSFNQERKRFVGIAADWDGKAQYALVSIETSPLDFKCLMAFSKSMRFCFCNSGTLLALSDGSVHSTDDGSLVKKMDWKF